ncbi:hypothetical protein KQI52_09905 [bacterium]|nr:hypothetical protein [bacterium]
MKYSTIITLFLLVTFSVIPSFSQPPQREWRRNWGFPYTNEAAYSVASLPGNGFVVGASTRIFSNSGLLLGFTQAGNVIGYQPELPTGRIYSIATLPETGTAWISNGNSIILGFTQFSGETPWSHTLPGFSRVVTNSNNNIVTAVSTDNVIGAPVELRTYSNTGTLLTTENYYLDNNGESAISSLSITSSGQYLMSGVISINDELQGWTLRLDENGDSLNVIYYRTYMHTSPAHDNGFYAFSLLTNELARFSATDELVWETNVDHYHEPDAPVPTADGGVIVLGFTGDGPPSAVADKFDAAGNALWSYQTQGPWFEDTYAYDGIGLEDGYLLVGKTDWPQQDYNYSQIWVERLGLDITDQRILAWPARDSVVVLPGESFRWNGRLKNNLSEPVTTDVWVQVLTPGGTLTDPVHLWEDVALSADEVIQVSPFQYVPTWVEPGTYHYLVRIGDYPQERYEDVFQFTVASTSSTSSPSEPDDWRLRLR